MLYYHISHDYIVRPGVHDGLYWNNRLVAGLSDPQFFESYEAIQGYRLNTMAQGYQSLHETDAALEKLAAEGMTMGEPTPNPDTKPDTGKDTQSPETGDGMTVTVWVMAATLSVAAVLVLSAKKREDRFSSQIAT